MAHPLRIGEFELLVVSDGVMRQDAGAVFGLVPRVMWEEYAGPLDAKYRMGLGLNSLVVRGRGRTVLVDTGCGSKGQRTPGAVSTEESGHLIDNLRAAGIAPEEVDVVINTHLHFDHCGGNTVVEAGKVKPAFPRARYLIARGEWDAATHTNERTRGTYLADNFVPLEDARQVELTDGVTEVTHGVRIVPAPGHTEDHVVVEVESEGDYALYVGELAQHPVMLERLAWISAFDVLPLVSLETKRRFVEKAMEKNATLVSVHSPYPGLGRLTGDSRRRQWRSLTEDGAGE
jgi:glyoxylase-like metal-dependent hydrolase (beta-lactamase superfamily II)